MRIVYNSFHGRYSDNPRALFEALMGLPDLEHVWLAHPDHVDGFPATVRTVDIESPAAVDALESADLLIANTHTEVEWSKRPGTRYLQTWHGTPMKRIHHDVLWAPPGRLARLDRDVAKWDVLLSPNAISTPLLRQAFRHTGEVWETGYPRNDLLTHPGRERRRRRTRHLLGLGEDTTAVLYAPTWRDDEFFGRGGSGVPLGLDLAALVDTLPRGTELLVRTHNMMTGRAVVPELERVHDVSYHSDIRHLYLAADVLVTDYSSVMFDFANLGRPMIFFTYDYEDYVRDERGTYVDLEQIAPGPMVTDTDGLVAALRNVGPDEAVYRERYAAFRERFCTYESGRAAERVADELLSGRSR